jgi:predicted transcriptional regulator YdeE
MTEDNSVVPKGMVAIDVPAAEYAVFSVPKADNREELIENIKKTWKFIFNDWLMSAVINLIILQWILNITLLMTHLFMCRW